jgi:hypothetical protein
VLPANHEARTPSRKPIFALSLAYTVFAVPPACKPG